MPERPVPEKFLVAFSLAGEERELVQAVAQTVEDRLGRGQAFLDEWFEHYVAGDDADLKLQEIYARRCELAVVRVSGQYPWAAGPPARRESAVNHLATSGCQPVRAC